MLYFCYLIEHNFKISYVYGAWYEFINYCVYIASRIPSWHLKRCFSAHPYNEYHSSYGVDVAGEVWGSTGIWLISTPEKKYFINQLSSVINFDTVWDEVTWKIKQTSQLCLHNVRAIQKLQWDWFRDIHTVLKLIVKKKMTYHWNFSI